MHGCTVYGTKYENPVKFSALNLLDPRLRGNDEINVNWLQAYVIAIWDHTLFLKNIINSPKSDRLLVIIITAAAMRDGAGVRQIQS